MHFEKSLVHFPYDVFVIFTHDPEHQSRNNRAVSRQLDPGGLAQFEYSVPTTCSVAQEKQGTIPEWGGAVVANRTEEGLAADMWAYRKTKVRPRLFSSKHIETETNSQSSRINEMAMHR